MFPPAILAHLLLFVLLGDPPSYQPRETPWRLGARPTQFAFDTAGAMTDTAGAYVRLRSLTIPSAAGGMVMKQMPTSGLYRDTVVVYGEMRLRDVGGNASVFVSTYGSNDKFIDGRVTRDLKGTTAWTPFFAMVEVAAGAATINYGLMLVGGGEMEVRALKMDIRRAAR